MGFMALIAGLVVCALSSNSELSVSVLRMDGLDPDVSPIFLSLVFGNPIFGLWGF